MHLFICMHIDCKSIAEWTYLIILKKANREVVGTTPFMFDFWAGAKIFDTTHWFDTYKQSYQQ